MYEKAMNAKGPMVAAAVAMLLLVGASVAYATGGDSPEQQATGPGVEEAKAAALEHTGGGRVTGAEVRDEEGYYEIEVTRDDGSQLDVHLDRGLDVLSTPGDRETPDDKDGPNDN